MQRRALAPLAAAVFLVPAEQAFAQNDPTIVRVALLDVTAIGGHGPGSGGRGMMGGWGAGPPQGDGWFRGGPGMMGQGMAGIGMMSIRADHGDAKAGALRFEVTNWSRSTLHEMLIIAVDHAQAPLPYDAAANRVPENQVRVLGDTGDMQPNASKTLDVTLVPGTYLLLCNLPGHYAAGMVTPFTVTR
jgi:uncharacterized cupredoxin-like copper-binding protein